MDATSTTKRALFGELGELSDRQNTNYILTNNFAPITEDNTELYYGVWHGQASTKSFTNTQAGLTSNISDGGSNSATLNPLPAVRAKFADRLTKSTKYTFLFTLEFIILNLLQSPQETSQSSLLTANKSLA